LLNFVAYSLSIESTDLPIKRVSEFPRTSGIDQYHYRAFSMEFHGYLSWQQEELKM
jgi:hypothetical protein